MQLFAYDGNQIIFAEDGIKKQDYLCPECLGILRVKEGVQRRKHFFHLNSHSPCRQNRKDTTHLFLQKEIYSLLPKEEAKLEWPFSSVHRIADIVWLPQKIVFEIQCSPISLQEVEARIHDYRQEGFYITWILYDRYFNKINPSVAELFLRTSSAYFVRWIQRRILIYDQWEIYKKGKRSFKSAPLPVHIHLPLPPPNSSFFKSLPSICKNRFSNLFYYFQGDLLDYVQKNPSYKQWIQSIEAKNKQGFHFFLKIKSLYKLLFFAFLKKIANGSHF